jgi:exonuclease III
MSLHKTNIGNNLTDTNIERFQNLVYSEDPDIVCVNETWLNEDIKNSEILHSGYNIFRNDRESRGGGVLLAIKISSFKSVREIQHGHDLEIAVAEITTTSNASLLICSCYRPPNSDHSWLDKFNNFMGDVCLGHSNIVLAGDFNMPHVSWDSPEKTSGGNENTFVELLHDHFLEQLNTAPTRGNNTLDLVLTNIPNKVKICEILSPTQAELFTDHNIIVFELSMCLNQLPKIRRTVYNYRQGDFAGLRTSLENV